MIETAEQNAAPTRELVTFRVCEQEYCVDITSVKEIRGWTPATPLPHVPPYIKGVINLRGSVLPIVDLGMRLGLNVEPPTSRNVIMIVQHETQVSGYLVDAVSDILTIQEDQLQSAPDVSSAFTKKFIKGVFALDSRMIRYIDLVQVMPTKEETAA